MNDDVRVVELMLPDNTVWGPIPREVDYLQELQRLDLSNNNVNGPLPSEIGNLRDLVELNLSENTFLGSGTSIPAALGKLDKLQRLSLSGTRFEGIPKELGKLESLTRLDLAEIPFLRGSIPPEFGDLSSLEHLDVSSSGRLEGALPQSLVNLSLDLFHWDRTNLCSPDNEEFQEWLDGIKDHKGGRKCDG